MRKRSMFANRNSSVRSPFVEAELLTLNIQCLRREITHHLVRGKLWMLPKQSTMIDLRSIIKNLKIINKPHLKGKLFPLPNFV